MSGACPRCGGNDWAPRSDKYGPRCRTCLNKYQRERREQNPHEVLFDNAKRRARTAGLLFTITHADVKAVLADWTCAYCDQPVGSFHGGTRPQSATLDRVIPTEGYVPGNIVIACHRCNASKAEHTPASLRDWANRIEAVINRKNPNEAT